MGEVNVNNQIATASPALAESKPLVKEPNSPVATPAKADADRTSSVPEKAVQDQPTRATETKQVDPLERLVKDLTGFNFEQKQELLDFLKSQHTIIHEKYGLPPDELMEPGKQQQYLDKMLELIDRANVHLEFKKTQNGLGAEYNHEGMYFTSHPKRVYRGIITVDPERIDIQDGIQINRILGHEYIHHRQIAEATEQQTKALELSNMEFEAYVGSIIIDEQIDLKSFFSTIQRSLTSSCSPVPNLD